MGAPDGGWGWMVVFGTFIIYFAKGGIERAFGVWYVEILDRYDEGAALSSWAIGIHAAVRQMLFIVGAFLYVRFSIRALIMAGGVIMSLGIFCSAFATNIYVFYITFSIIGGFGASLAVFGAQIAISEYFDKRKFLAQGLSITGAGCGGCVLSTMLTYLFLNVTYFETVIILSGIALNIVVGGCVCFPVYDEIDDTEDSKPVLDDEGSVSSYSSHSEHISMRPYKPKMKVRKLTGKRNFEVDLLYNPIVIIYTIGAFVSLVGSLAIPQFIVDYAVEQGESLEIASLLLSITGFIEIFVRIFLGFLMNTSFIRPYVIHVWNMSFILYVVCALIIAFSTTFWQFLIGLFLNVICTALARAYSVVMLSSVFENSALVSAITIYNNGYGFGTLAGAPVAGLIKDVTGSYFGSYLMLSGVCFLSSIFYWGNLLLIKRLRHNARYRLLKE